MSGRLLKKYITIFLHTIASGRNFFDHSNFHPGSLNSIKFPQLKKGVSVNVDSFLNWIGGIYDVIDHKYLKALQLGVYSTQENPDELDETYLFELDYNNGRVHFSNSYRKVDASVHNIEFDDYTSLEEFQTILTQLTSSCQERSFPRERFVSMKMLFNSNCPSDIQPDYFRDYSNEININLGKDVSEFGFDPLASLILKDPNCQLNMDEDTATTIIFPEIEKSTCEQINQTKLQKDVSIHCECGFNEDSPFNECLNNAVIKCTKCSKSFHRHCYNYSIRNKDVCITCEDLIHWKSLLMVRAIYKLFHATANPHLNDLFDLSNETICVILKFFFETKNLIMVSSVPKRKNGAPYNCIGTLIIDETVKWNFVGAEINPTKLLFCAFTPKAKVSFRIKNTKDITCILGVSNSNARILNASLERLANELRERSINSDYQFEDSNLSESLTALSQIAPSQIPEDSLFFAPMSQMSQANYNLEYPTTFSQHKDSLRQAEDPLEWNQSQNQSQWFDAVEKPPASENRLKRPSYSRTFDPAMKSKRLNSTHELF